MSCCSGSGDTIMAAKNALAGMLAAPLPPGQVRMEYIGANVGAISFFGKHGAEYRGGQNDLERFVDVHEDDVEKLVNSGYWQISLMVQQAPQTINSVTPAPEPVAKTRTPEPELAAVSVPDVIEVTAEDEAINKMIDESRKAQAKKSKR